MNSQLHSTVRTATVAITVALWGAICASAESGPAGGEGIDWRKAREFWAFRPPQPHALPPVQKQDWARTRTDHFILAAQEKLGLSPSVEADGRTLIRRVTFDLTGLPPTPEEVQAFLADQSTGAYDNLVERLLGSPRFGERMASLWLNVARYAEDQAHQVGNDTKSFYPNAFRYREWVIDSFNRDLPYDQFIKLQIAADKMEGDGPKDIAALGFLGLGPKYYSRNRLNVMADEWEDRVDTVTRSFLGLTVACARCHDHKYDPITMQDYYGLAGVFASTRMVNKSPDGTVETGTPEAAKMRPETLHIVEDGDVQDLTIFLRGNVDDKGPVAGRRFLRVLCEGEPAKFSSGSGRSELADAIASRANPLAARVMVNRLWAIMFGTPLVGTPSNFGSLGDRPTHPELLDDLAVRFMENGWSVKTILRELARSTTYRQASRASAEARSLDADNRFLSHTNRRRLPVEMWRDAVMAVSGTLETAGGPSLEVDDPKNHHRTVYSRISRLKLNDVLMQFDYPDANVHAEKRSVTTTAMQKLFLLNSPFMLETAKALAGRLTADPMEDNRARVDRAYRLLYCRVPTETESKLALEFLGRAGSPEMSQWEQYAQALVAANEMLYVD